MNKIEEIFRAWITAAKPTKSEAELAAKRYSICLKCEWIKDSIIFDTKCGECGCPINKKIFSPVKGACRIGKWDDVDSVDKSNTKESKTII